MAWRSSSLRVWASLPLFKKAGKNETLALHFSEADNEVVVKSVWMEMVEVGCAGKSESVKGWWKWRSFRDDDDDEDEDEEEWMVERYAGELEEDKAMVTASLNYAYALKDHLKVW